LLDGAPEMFRRGRADGVRSEEAMTAPLYQEIGRLKMELEWLKKSCERPLRDSTRMDPPRAQRRVDRTAMCLGGTGPLDLLL
jgi:putative transposase